MATDKERNKRLIKTYGITLEEYNQMLQEQGGGCQICKKIPEVGAKSLHVDHCHKHKYVKLVSLKTDDLWTVSCNYRDRLVTANGKKINDVKKEVRQKLKKLSVRGLLCFCCNRGLRLWFDNYDNMYSAACYLKTFSGK